MSNNTNIPSYNFTHISSYVNGTMSREDMYAFEKAILNDPFLEDAVDGYRAANISKAKTDLTAIKAALLPKTETTKFIPFYKQYKSWLNAAAAIIIVASLGAITYSVFNNTSKNKQVAIVTPTTEKAVIKTDTTSINSRPIITNKPAHTVSTYNQKPVIVADKQVTLSLAKQETVSAFDDIKRSTDTANYKAGSLVTTLTEKELNSLPATNIAQALQGRAAGISVDKNSKKEIVASNPPTTSNGFVNTNNANNKILIRGNSSINKNQQPIYVINGLRYDSLPSYVNANTIKSIEILKDSTAAAIYGASAINGVIVVTTNNQAAELLAKQNASTKAKETDYLAKSMAVNNAVKLQESNFTTPAKDSTAASKTNLDEVVVIGYGTAKKKYVTANATKRPIDPLDSLMPVGGWQYYSKYITQKIGFIGDTTSNNELVLTDKNGHKLDDIDIEFSVDKEGTAYNVTVITEIDSTKAKALANAITEGPKWISHKKKNKVKIPLKNP